MDSSKDSPVLDSSHDSSHDSPVLDSSPDSPVLDSSPDSPVLDSSHDSPVLDSSHDSPVLDSSHDSPVLDSSKDSEQTLKDAFDKLDCSNEKYYSKECNKFLLKKELVERKYLLDHPDENTHLYPNLNDPHFNIKIAEKKEFHETKYDGKIHDNVQEYADILANADFELSPHQTFVKNFLSFQTPYSSLLLFHGLGTGKTCSAIGVCEEMRDYMKQTGATKRIIIVASENVQENFKLQLFDERKLKNIDGVWNMSACTGNKLLKEINPMNMKGLSKEKIVSQIKNLINTYYIFLGYGQFANYIIKTMNYDEEMEKQNREKKRKPGEKSKIHMLKDVKLELNSRIIRRLQNEFDSRLIVIDEVHNIRKTDDNENKKVAINLELLVKSCKNMRFLLLSATPMYNSYKEIIWLLNLMNSNDKRGLIEVKEIFDKDGNFKPNGRELLIQKATGYISFVRGENPYSFPYRVYPNEFAKKHSFSDIKYPSYQMNLKKIKKEDKKRILSLYLSKIGGCNNCGICQYCAYKYIIYYLRNKSFSITTKTGIVKEMPDFENMESFGYTLLKLPLECLIISYPDSELKKYLDEIPDVIYSESLSPSFSDITPIQDKQEELPEIPGPVDIKIDESLTELEEIPIHFEPIKVDKSLKIDEPIKVDESLKVVGSLKVEEEEIIVKQNKKCKKGTRRNKITKNCDPINKEQPKEEKEEAIQKKEEEIEKKEEEETKRCKKGTRRNKITKECEEYVKVKKGGGESDISDTSISYDQKFIGLNPNKLTGRLGLERVMSYVDLKSPPQKGNFKYRKGIESQYGKIFSREIIGKYSAKIKSVLDNIFNPETNQVSEGIILIYSQYIDSGLIPMALALEEMGFTRYGKDVKSLFEEPPTPIVDVRTMKPPIDKKNFMPARYSMITGDTRISPDNTYEVKGLTNDDNKNGNKLKVVLISKAGSEGIDFKFIRQVHILDPWYNTNRIEQVIGRAVRSFSHKDIPFEKRNVQIFMHGTILNDNKEEAADLYVYRVAEYKAIQIGKITRILKETAVDCIINHAQTNFTQEIMSKYLSKPITQELSTHKILENFKIGDAPFSPACDYMKNCNYKCIPHTEINEKNLNQFTYNENFVFVNSEKILQRIRMLMKENFFYKKHVLIQRIKAQKEYPLIQIYAALTHLIEDENEFIVDKYGRNGRLINIGDYYLFQPLELINNNVSIYDRSVPIKYKHDMIQIEFKKKLEQPEEDSEIPALLEYKKEDIFLEGKKIFEEMNENIKIIHEYEKKTKNPVSDDNWYKHYGIAAKKIARDFPEATEFIIPCAVAHMIECLLFQDKIHLMNYIYSLEQLKDPSLELLIKNYFQLNTITTRKFQAFLMYNLKKQLIMILDENNTWIEANSEDQREIAATKEAKQYLSFNEKEYNNIIGFIGYGKGNNYMVFKTKNMTSKRDTGARCDESGKANIIQKLNKILGEEKYTSQNTKQVKDANGNIISLAISSIELCIFKEFILRFFNSIQKDGKKWFLTPELAIWFKIYTIY